MALRYDLSDHTVMTAGDHDRLTSVIVILLSNAIRSCLEQSGDVVIRLRPTIDCRRIEVINNDLGHCSRPAQADLREVPLGQQ
jgi:signal transduction histidine kinase